MSDQKIALSPYAKIRYNVSGEVSFDVGMNYLGALIIIAGADGALSEQELDWLLSEQQLLGAPQELLDNIKSYDWQNADLNALLEAVQYEFPMNARRTLLYQAVKMSRADQVYHRLEREAIWKAAEILKIDKDIVQSIESLVDMENATDKLRYALIGTLAEE